MVLGDWSFIHKTMKLNKSFNYLMEITINTKWIMDMNINYKPFKRNCSENQQQMMEGGRATPRGMHNGECPWNSWAISYKLATLSSSAASSSPAGIQDKKRFCSYESSLLCLSVPRSDLPRRAGASFRRWSPYTKMLQRLCL